uniref:Uncharacterized protein n=1 Tax=Romanomermis culicivorax TaxID=13658 RepID=A0A915JTE2_ROMCU
MENNNMDDEEKFQDFQSRKSLKEQIAAFDEKSANQERNLSKNPYSQIYKRPAFDKNADQRYGRPEQGSKTERRGISADVTSNFLSDDVIAKMFP